MKDYIDILREALKDQQVKGIACLIPDDLDNIKKSLSKFPKARYLSEWRYEVGKITYRYHVHNADLGEKLKKLFKEGKTSRHPKLTDILKIKEIDSVLSKPIPVP